jgi:phosphoribosylformimino-5-aminoimidazole carboxamide ribotide isomerase
MITVIPAIDIIEGKCVRLTRGDYDKKKVYNEDPLEVARMFEHHGLKRLHLVDLDGAKEKHVVNWRVLEKIVSRTSLTIDFGGGIKTDDDIRIVFNSGADMATIGSVAVTEKDIFLLWLQRYGAERLILGADVKDNKVAISGWQEVTDNDLFSFLSGYTSLGVKNVLCTDISKDGMLEGTAIDLYSELRKKFPDLYLIASGGITGINELEKLDESGINGAVIGKAIYEGYILLSDLEKFILKNN